MANLVGGVFTIMPTPFHDGGELDLDSLARLTDFLIGLGVDGVVVLGVMGEAPKLSDGEQEKVIKATVEAARGRVEVFAGSSSPGIDLTIEKSTKALELGATGLLVAPPPVQNDSVILEFYRRLDERVEAPIVLHDYPSTTGILMSPELISKLGAELDNIAALKLEDPPTVQKIGALKRLGSDITILGGLGGLYFYEELQRGMDGMMTGFSYPEILISILRDYRSGDRKRAAHTFFSACPLLRYEFQPGIGLAIRKEIYRQRGAIASAHVRYPGVQVSDEMRQDLAELLASDQRVHDLATP